jgi:hypothetical protein
METINDTYTLTWAPSLRGNDAEPIGCQMAASVGRPDELRCNSTDAYRLPGACMPGRILEGQPLLKIHPHSVPRAEEVWQNDTMGENLRDPEL